MSTDQHPPATTQPTALELQFTMVFIHTSAMRQGIYITDPSEAIKELKACTTAIMESDMVRRACIVAFHAILEDQTSPIRQSANILERNFREGIEYYKVKNEAATSWDEMDTWHVAPDCIGAMIDALLQVRDQVAKYVKYEEKFGNPHLEFGPNATLYTKFRQAGIIYPLEPNGMFDKDFWAKGFNSERFLKGYVTLCQIWAIWMQLSLDLIMRYDGAVDNRAERMMGWSCLYHLIHVAWEDWKKVHNWMTTNPLDLRAPIPSAELRWDVLFGKRYEQDLCVVLMHNFYYDRARKPDAQAPPSPPPSRLSIKAEASDESEDSVDGDYDSCA
ncbi:hypothetical protein RhiLY_10108 [Ceratobasidium sp. AG-Ba]|nr:hypothetical protein RhiLY_10108 [Ceratobasidium sp. AG-Ba]